MSYFGATVTGHTWNGGKCCFSHADDLSFLKKVVNTTKTLLKVDHSRVYATGFSAGGVMSHTLACQAADIFAAVASVDGPIEVKEACAPSRPVPVLHFHGRLDEVFPYGGVIYNGAPQTIAAWRKANACQGDATAATVKPLITSSTSMNCTAAVEVELVTIDLGIHAMPPARMFPEQYIWNFLSKWKL